MSNRAAGLPPSGPSFGWRQRARKVVVAVREGRVGQQEAETLVGYLLLGGRHLSERTRRKREARLLELGAGPDSIDPVELQAVELWERISSGELSYDDAELRAGRFLLAEARFKRGPS